MKRLVSIFLSLCLVCTLVTMAFATNDPLQLSIDGKTATINDWYLDDGEPMVSVKDFCEVFGCSMTQRTAHYYTYDEYDEFWESYMKLNSSEMGKETIMQWDENGIYAKTYNETYMKVVLQTTVTIPGATHETDIEITLRPTHKYIPDLCEVVVSTGKTIIYTGYNGGTTSTVAARMQKPSVLKNGVVYVPIRSLSEGLFYTGKWESDNNKFEFSLNENGISSDFSYPFLLFSNDIGEDGVDWILDSVIYDSMIDWVTDGNYYGLVPYNELKGNASDGNTSDDEHIYDTSDPGEDIVLPVWRLEEVIDADCTVRSIDTLLEEVPKEQLQTPTGTDLATLYAETALMRAACKNVDGGDLLINASLLKIVESVAVQAQGMLEEKLESVGIPPAREISKTVTLTTDETSLDIHIDPDVLQTQIDKIRVETPTYALTFKIEDLKDDLTDVLQFRAEDSGAGYAPSRTTKKAGTKTVVKIDLPKPKMSNPVTVSMPKQTGETVHQAVVSTDGQATASKYNPASDLMDGKVNTSGSYTVRSNEKDFSDIANKSQEMQKAIRYLASKGIINGTTETAFSPDGSINRAEIATLIVKALGKLDASAAASFTDVQRGSWYYPAAASSQKQGYIQGYEDRTFRGMTTISKVQIISVSSRVLQKEMRYKVPAAPASILTKYGDTVDAWAQSDVALATKENLVLYRRDGTFSGRHNMTRGDAAIIIYRLFQKIW